MPLTLEQRIKRIQANSRRMKEYGVKGDLSFDSDGNPKLTKSQSRQFHIGFERRLTEKQRENELALQRHQKQEETLASQIADELYKRQQRAEYQKQLDHPEAVAKRRANAERERHRKNREWDRQNLAANERARERERIKAQREKANGQKAYFHQP